MRMDRSAQPNRLRPAKRFAFLSATSRNRRVLLRRNSRVGHCQPRRPTRQNPHLFNCRLFKLHWAIPGQLRFCQRRGKIRATSFLSRIAGELARQLGIATEKATPSGMTIPLFKVLGTILTTKMSSKVTIPSLGRISF